MQLTTYGKLNAAQYALDNADPPKEMLAFYWEQCEAAFEPVLEPMCGTGRFLIPFLERVPTSMAWTHLHICWKSASVDWTDVA